MKPTTRAALALISLLALSACGSTTDDTHPIGIGTGENSLKLSPCAMLAPPASTALAA